MSWVHIGCLTPPERVNHRVEATRSREPLHLFLAARAKIISSSNLTTMWIIDLKSGLRAVSCNSAWRFLGTLSTPRRWRFFHNLLSRSILLRKYSRRSTTRILGAHLGRLLVHHLPCLLLNITATERMLLASSLVSTAWRFSQSSPATRSV